MVEQNCKMAATVAWVHFGNVLLPSLSFVHRAHRAEPSILLPSLAAAVAAASASKDERWSVVESALR